MRENERGMAVFKRFVPPHNTGRVPETSGEWSRVLEQLRQLLPFTVSSLGASQAAVMMPKGGGTHAAARPKHRATPLRN